MHLGTQLPADTLERMGGDRYLRQLAQLGLRHVCVDPPGDPHGWSADDLARHVDRLDRAGLVLDMVQLPLASRPIAHSQSPNVLLGREPERGREIDSICRLVERLGAVGVPAAKYNLTFLGVLRTEPRIGRGGARLPSFALAEAADAQTPTEAGPVDEALFWERIEHFLRHVVPVAEASGVRLACHPHDPPVPPGHRGVTRVLGTVEGLKRLVATQASPVHGLNFCQGTIAEGLDRPREEIGDVIRWFGERGHIVNVHFRNIRGRMGDFVETFPDDGDVDMPACFRLYRDVGYRGMVMPDHVPAIDGAAPAETAFAFAFGYIAGLFQAHGMDPRG